MAKISKKASSWLLALARQSIEYFLETKNFLPFEKLKIPPEIKEEVIAIRAGFVLLEMQGNEHRKPYVHGVNGLFEAVEPLGKLITQLAVNAAFFDPSTPRLKPYELNELIIHVFLPRKRKRVVVESDIKIGEGILLEVRGRMAFELPILINTTESVEHRLRRFRLKLGVSRKSAEKDIKYYTFGGQHLSD